MDACEMQGGEMVFVSKKNKMTKSVNKKTHDIGGYKYKVGDNVTRPNNNTKWKISGFRQSGETMLADLSANIGAQSVTVCCDVMYLEHVK